MKKAGRAVFWILFLALYAAGSAFILYPFIGNALQSASYTEAIEEFQNLALSGDEEETEVSETSEAEDSGGSSGSAESEEDASPDYTELLELMQAYNEQIWEEGQSGLVDAWSYEQAAVDLSGYGIEDGVIGYITIPAMDSEMPIYLGATEENMSKGVVNLGETSLPIGGENTNCVLAAHRGYSGIAFWREIEKIELVDYVYITNLWETLTYQVCGIEIIDPDEMDKVLIQEGRDMVTLVTCHPYRGHGAYRYVVYCERVYGEVSDPDLEEEESGIPLLSDISGLVRGEDSGADISVSDGSAFESSEQAILLEQVLQTAGLILDAAVLAALLVMLFRHLRKRRKRKKQNDGSG